MKANTYYLSIADSIYGLYRKSTIFVTEIKKKTFIYHEIEWRCRNRQDGKEEMFAKYCHIQRRVGKLKDFDSFREINLPN